jgi:hypothetical protein
MKLAALPLAFLCGSLTVAAQSSSRKPTIMAGSNSKVTLYALNVDSGGCPVGMRLDQRLGGRLETVQDGKSTETGATRLDLTATILNFTHHSQVESARITVHYFDGRQHLELIGADKATAETASPASPRADASGKTMDVDFAPIGSGKSAAAIWLAAGGSVSFLEVDSIVFADGATWKPVPGRSCRVRPNPFQLVSAH